MNRPLCTVCLQRVCAVNYKKHDIIYYRKRCETCIRKNRNIKPRIPKWQASGYIKKNFCELCKFRAKYSQQILVYHIDGNLNNTDIKNLRSICQNCAIAVGRSDHPWLPGDLELDVI